MEIKKPDKNDLSYTQPSYIPSDKKIFITDIEHFQTFQIEQFLKFEIYVKKMIYNHLFTIFKNEFNKPNKKYMHIPRFNECSFENEIKKNINIFLKKYIKSKDNLNYYGKYLNDQIINEYKMIYNFIRSKTIHMIINQEILLVHDFKKIFEIVIERKTHSIGLYNLELLILNKKFIVEYLREVNPLCDVLNTRLRNETSTSLIEYMTKRYHNIILPEEFTLILAKVTSIGGEITRYENLMKQTSKLDDNIMLMIQQIIYDNKIDLESDLKMQYHEYIQSILFNLEEIKIDYKLSQKMHFTSVSDRLIIIIKMCCDFYSKINHLNINYENLFQKYLRRLLSDDLKIKLRPDNLFNDFKALHEITKYQYNLEINQIICDFSNMVSNDLRTLYNILVDICTDPENIHNEISFNTKVIIDSLKTDPKSIQFLLYQVFYHYIDKEIIVDVDINDFVMPKTSEEKIKLFDRIDSYVDTFYFDEVSEILTVFSEKYSANYKRFKIIYYVFINYINLRLDQINKKKQEYENLFMEKKTKECLDIQDKIFEMFDALNNEYNKYLEFFLLNCKTLDADQSKTNEDIKKEFTMIKNRFFENDTLDDYDECRIKFSNRHKISTIIETIEVEKLDDEYLISLFNNIKTSIFFDIFFKNESAFYFEIDYFYDNLEEILFEKISYIQKNTEDYENIEYKENAHNQNEIRKQLKMLSSYYKSENDFIDNQGKKRTNDSNDQDQ